MLNRELNIKPESTYTIDEKWYLLGKVPKVKMVVYKWWQNSCNYQVENCDIVTVFKTVLADSQVLPPMNIYNDSTYSMGWHAAV
jgi:hypothetical protein